jgi:hypothetical protein
MSKARMSGIGIDHLGKAELGEAPKPLHPWMRYRSEHPRKPHPNKTMNRIIDDLHG